MSTIDKVCVMMTTHESARLNQENKRLQSIVDAATDAMDVADRLIERSMGTDAMAEWHKAYRRVAKVRARL